MAATRRGHRREREAGGIAEPEQEIRFGLVLYGGVSLAIYIYGVVSEFCRLVRASHGREDNAWSALLEAAGASATVDIVSGASAGGINGVLLGKALAAGGDLRAVRPLWVKEADIERLLHGSADPDPRSLLRSDRFEELLAEGLDTMDREGDSQPVVGVFDLFASGTRVRPWVRPFPTDLGDTIESSDYRETFRLRYRRSGYNDEAPELGYDVNDFGAAGNGRLVDVARSTSAFPGAFEPVTIAATKAEKDLGKPDPSYFADGGILHNKPFTETIATILTRAADRPVRRWLVSVEPDPEHAVRHGEHEEAPEVTEVVSKALFGIPRYQSVAADLERIQEHREHVARAREIITELDASLARRLPRRGGASARTLHEAIPFDYRRQRMEQLVEELAQRTGDARQTIGAQLGTLLEGLDAADAAFDRRRVRHLLELVRGDFDLAEDGRAALQELKLRLWGEADRIEDLLWRLLEDPARPELTYPDLGEALAEGLNGIRGRTWVVCAALDGLLGERRAGAHPPYTVVFDEFELWDMVLLPLEQVSSVGARDTIRLARISPQDARFTGKPAKDKLAGDTLAHFGGFLKEQWRTNDILWGRLDAAEQITRVLFEHAGLDDEAVGRHVRAVQAEIAAEELPDLMGDYVHHLETDRIGKEGLDDLPAPQRKRLLLRTGDVVQNMARGVERRDPEDALSVVFGAIGAVLRVVLAIARRPALAVAVAVAVVLVAVAVVTLLLA